MTKVRRQARQFCRQIVDRLIPDRDGNQIFGPSTYITFNSPTYLAFTGVRGLTLFQGFGEVWIPPDQVPREEDYC